LLEAIRSEIRRDGPMKFARFMELALYDPDHVYYRSADARPGRQGDFLTAPEAHPLFGRALSRVAAAIHDALGSPGDLTIREHGAGTGALAEPLVAALVGPSPDVVRPPRLIRYLVDEIEPSRVDAVRERLALVAATAGVTIDVARDDRRPIDGLAIANEVVDALPVHRVIQRGVALREILVGIDPAGALVEVEAPPSTPALATRLSEEAIVLRDGQVAEICLAVDGWVERAAAGLRDGVLLLIDYGYPAAELYDGTRRAAGTLVTYQGHRAGADPFRAIGRQDLTAHVDITAVEAAAARSGLVELGVTTQGRFLAALGIGDLLVAEQTRPGATLQSYLEARSAVVRMIDPAATGRFRVLAFGAGRLARLALPGFDGASPDRPGG
ncbi:MAG TPA: SAM-dependent methyltransferase, partial [Candidatus Limnocylindrales bacterium]|nr:SAM-dependent methyltransferase [Candidatus Limnocylindrales bacterium]